MPLSTNAPFSEFGQSMILRDIEQLYLSLNGAGTGSPGDGATQDQEQGVTQDVDISGLATTEYVDGQDNGIYEYIDAAIGGLSPDPPVGGDLSGVASNATVTRLRGVNISTTLPSVDEQALLYNAPLTKWEPVTLIAANGGILSKDSGGLVEVAGGTALSVVGNATNTAGSINAIPAASADTVLGRRGTTLTWAKVSTAEINDAAVTKAKIENSVAASVIGRSAASTGVTADIVAGADDTVLTRLSGTLSFASVSRNALAQGTACTVIGRSANSTGVVADIAASANGQILTRASNALSFSATPTLGVSGTTNGSITLAGATAATTMALACSGANATITIGNATSASAIVISPSLVTAAGRIMSVREIDVCDAGVAKKMLVLASAPY